MPTEYIQNARKDTPAPNIAHGQSLIWNGPDTGVQGVIELHECQRTKDAWLQSVCNSFRCGTLSIEIHQILHRVRVAYDVYWQ